MYLNSPGCFGGTEMKPDRPEWCWRVEMEPDKPGWCWRVEMEPGKPV